MTPIIRNSDRIKKVVKYEDIKCIIASADCVKSWTVQEENNDLEIESNNLKKNVLK